MQSDEQLRQEILQKWTWSIGVHWNSSQEGLWRKTKLAKENSGGSSLTFRLGAQSVNSLEALFNPIRRNVKSFDMPVLGEGALLFLCQGFEKHLRRQGHSLGISWPSTTQNQACPFLTITTEIHSRSFEGHRLTMYSIRATKSSPIDSPTA